MRQTEHLLAELQRPTFPADLPNLYGENEALLDRQKRRYCRLLECFRARFPDDTAAEVFSSPGRTEVGGNHTDHNGGRVLAAAVNLDVLAVASPVDEAQIVIESEGYPQVQIDTRQLAMIEQEKYSTNALVRGVCARMRQMGYAVGGFHACMTSSVPDGSGLSSSAAFELMIVTILNELYNQGRVPPVQAALIGQYAENVYFGKPSGLMDQTTSAVGGFVMIDFKDFDHPQVHKVNYTFAGNGYSLVIVGTGASHADLNDDYAEITSDMRAVASIFGGQVLRDIAPKWVYEKIADLRGQVSDRAILRALHFFADDQRVTEQVRALENGQFDAFLQLVNESGISSWTLNQNVFTPKRPAEQGISLALALAEMVLKGRGAWRVHGGGFAGTIQAFVPDDLVAAFIARMAPVFGEENCHLVQVRAPGATRVAL